MHRITLRSGKQSGIYVDAHCHSLISILHTTKVSYTIYQMKTILIIDDEDGIAETLKEYLVSKNFSVTCCVDSTIALKHYIEQKPDLVLSDIKMPKMSGIELFQKCQAAGIQKNIPFVLMTSYSDIIGVETAFSMGISELIAKPFDLESVNLVINYLLNLDGSIGSDEKYYPVRINEFIQSKKLEFDIYLKIESRFVLVTRSGQEFSEQRILNFERKGVKTIYLCSEDFARYTEMQFALATQINKRPIDVVRKTRVMNHLMTSVTRSFMSTRIEPEIFSNALTSFEAYAQISLNNNQLSEVLNQALRSSLDLVEKSALRAMLSSMVTTQWHWNSSKFQSRIILAALMCDIGLKDFQHLLKKSVYDYTPEEKQQYLSHPFESYRILREISGMPEEIVLVALQHHENSAGLGFPQKLNRNKLHSFSVIIHCVIEFIETLYNQEDKENIENALEHLLEVQGKMINQQVIKTLYILFQLPVPKKLEALLLPNQTARLN